MAPWFPEMMTRPPPALQLPELLSITPPRCDHHQTSGTENPSHQPSEMLDLLCCCWTPWWQEQKLSCHLQHFTALSGTMPSVLHPLHGSLWLSLTPVEVPAVEDKGCTTGEPGLGPLHHPRWQESLGVTHPWLALPNLPLPGPA